MFAYVAATNHCALLESICDNAGCNTHLDCEHHVKSAGGSGEKFCELDNNLLGRSSAPAAKIFAMLGALLLPAVLFFGSIRFLITNLLLKIRPTAPLSDDWLGVIRRRHIIYRAAGFARAP